MRNRIISLVLAIVMIVSVLYVPVSAAEELTASDEAIRILKAEEGFSSTPYWDYAQWTVGYGTACPEDRREYYNQFGISEDEAEQLLRNFVAKFEKELHAFAERNGVTLTQNQFDALLLFSYNCGTGWTYDTTCGIYNAVVNGTDGSKLVDAFSRWCNAGGQIKTFLLRRRLCEANIYLNGVYSQTAPTEMGYVLYDACGGVSKPNVQGYHTELTAEIIPTPTYDGYIFDGWYTERTGGTKVTVLDGSVRNCRLYAHWTDASGNTAEPETGSDTGVQITVTVNGVNLRQGAGTNYAVIGSANTGDRLAVTKTQEGSGYTWGKTSSGWICLKYTNYDILTKPEKEEPATQMGTVQVSDCLCIRSGPSTGYQVLGYLENGTRIEILEQKIVGSMIWGKIEKGWISLDYVKLDRDEQDQKPEDSVSERPEPEDAGPDNVAMAEKRTGTVKVSDYLCIRSGPSTSNPVVGSLPNGEKVTITEQTTSGSMTWGKIEKGWISLDYVQLDPQENAASQSVQGTVDVADYLRIRSGPSTSYAIAGYLADGQKVEILEQKKVGSTTWGRISRGWISLDYVKLEQQNESQQTTVKTVTAECLRVRGTAGTSGTIVGFLYAGAKVEILETTTVNGSQWGRTSEGWISLDYVK